MEVKVIMSDADYQRIIAANGKRVRGSIAMNSPQEFDFRAFTMKVSRQLTLWKAVCLHSNNLSWGCSAL